MVPSPCSAWFSQINTGEQISPVAAACSGASMPGLPQPTASPEPELFSSHWQKLLLLRSGLQPTPCPQLLAFLISFPHLLTPHSLLSASTFLSYIWFSYFSLLSSLPSWARVVYFFNQCCLLSQLWDCGFGATCKMFFNNSHLAFTFFWLNSFSQLIWFIIVSSSMKLNRFSIKWMYFQNRASL